MKKTKKTNRDKNILMSQMGLINMNTKSIKSKKVYKRNKKWDNE